MSAADLLGSPFLFGIVVEVVRCHWILKRWEWDVKRMIKCGISGCVVVTILI